MPTSALAHRSLCVCSFAHGDGARVGGFMPGSTHSPHCPSPSTCTSPPPCDPWNKYPRWHFFVRPLHVFLSPILAQIHGLIYPWARYHNRSHSTRGGGVMVGEWGGILKVYVWLRSHSVASSACGPFASATRVLGAGA